MVEVAVMMAIVETAGAAVVEVVHWRMLVTYLLYQARPILL